MSQKHKRLPKVEVWYGVFNFQHGPFEGSLFRRKAECEKWIRTEYLVGDDYESYRDTVSIRQLGVVIPACRP